MQSIQEVEQLDLWEEFFKDKHRTKVKELDLYRYSPRERNTIEQTAADIENYKLDFKVNYLSHRVIKSGSRIILQSLMQTVIHE